jgi:hypothetical protein
MEGMCWLYSRVMMDVLVSMDRRRNGGAYKYSNAFFVFAVGELCVCVITPVLTWLYQQACSQHHYVDVPIYLFFCRGIVPPYMLGRPPC